MSYKSILFIGFILAALGVILGAFGAHALKDTLGEYGTSIWEKGHLYQMFHALGIVAIGLIGQHQGINKHLGLAFYCMLAGIICFSGSLYLLALDLGWSWLGPITPIGGLFFIISWILLILAVLRNKDTLIQ